MEWLNELTPREREVIVLLAQGKSNRQIAEALVITERTVFNHLHSIFQKLGVSSRTEAVVYALRIGLLKIEEIIDEETVSGR